MTSSPHGLYAWGHTRTTMEGTEGRQIARVSKSRKEIRSSERSVQWDSLKAEALVIADQHAAVNTFPGLVHTARHTMGADCSRSRCANRKEAGAQGVVRDWGEVVTR